MKICIITGSTLGAAEYVGDHLADCLERRGHSVQIENQANLDDVRDQNLWLMVTSTHGAGDMPENLKPLFEQIAEQQPDLSRLRFAVVGLGNSDYDTYCYAVDKVEQQLTARGATQLCDSFRIDMQTEFDPEHAAENWLPNFLQAI